MRILFTILLFTANFLYAQDNVSSALKWLETGNYDRAINLLNIEIGHGTRDIDAYFARGMAYHGLGNLKAAMHDYNTAISMFPLNYDKSYMASVLDNRSQCYADMGNFKLAIADNVSALLCEISGHRYYTLGLLRMQSGDTIEGVLNFAPEDSKKFFAIQALTKNVPDRFEFRTPNNYTWLEDGDFTNFDDQWRSPIKQDATVSGNPDSDTEPMRGDYMFTKMFFTKGTYNVLYSMIIKVRAMFRKKQD